MTRPRLLLLALTAAAPAVRAASSLEAPCPVDWRAVPLSEAVRDLANRLEVPYLLDESVTEQMLAEPVRLSALHLSGRQAFRWTARVGGLEAVLVDHSMVIASPDRLPRLWRLAGRIGEAETSPGGTGQGSRPARGGKADLEWVDAPLSRVARDVATRYGVDLLFHPAILREEPLLRLEGSSLDLEAVRGALTTQLHAVARYDDGVLWVEPAALAQSRPSQEASEQPRATGRDDESPVLARRIEILTPPANWAALEQALGRGADVQCQIEAPNGHSCPAMTAQGTLFDVLEAGRLLEGWSWRLTRLPGSRQAFLLIQFQGSGRSVR